VTEKAKPVPNTRLRNERERRGWSREYVAEQISGNAQTVGRWERGTTSPSPYYRQRLCELFKMDAEELGLFEAEQEQVAQPDEEVNSREEAGSPPLSFMFGRGSFSKLLALLGVVIVISVLLSIFLSRLPIGVPIPNGSHTPTVQPTISLPTPHARAPIKPGGVWVNPANRQIVHGVMHFEAHGYPTNFGDPAIDHVNFTVIWPGSHWQVACIAYPAVAGDIFRCDVNLSRIGAPDGQVTVSFDVYDRDGNVNSAPNGEHMIMYYAV